MGWLTDLLKEVPMSAVMKERLAHEEKLHNETKAKNVELQLQVDELTKENATLKRELTGRKAVEDFFERDGLLWKRETGAGPFCPQCYGTMGRFGPRSRCPKCGIVG